MTFRFVLFWCGALRYETLCYICLVMQHFRRKHEQRTQLFKTQHVITFLYIVGIYIAL